MRVEMAEPVPSDKVKDKEYTNWLKVTLALYYMKSGLHTFIQREIESMHQSLVKKIYGGQTVPLQPCNICSASHVKRNKWTGVWAFQQRCRSYCDVWLDELLLLHNNPKSEKIYWNNTDVSSWPFRPWQCAKVFMPRGQPPSNVGPAECDAQALLTLISNCKHFHHKLSLSGQGLIHTVSDIRNKVMHNGEMKLSDTDRNNYIQQIIQLIEDPVILKSAEDCKAAAGNIRKIDNDAVDVFFNVGLELTAMREAVNELRQELGNQEKGTAETIDKLEEEYEQLREKLQNRFEDFEKELVLHETRMDTIERDVESVKEKTDSLLQQQEKKLQEIHATVTSEQKRFENVETKMDTIVRDVRLVKEETESALQQQDKKCQEMHTTFTQLTETLHERVASQDVKMDTIVRDVQSVKEERESVLQQQEKHTQMTEILYERVASQDVRLLAVEENVSKLHFDQRTEKKKSCGKETLRKRKPKTEGLRQLKGTEGQKRRKHCDQDGPKPEIIMLNQEGTNAQKRSLDGDQDGPAPKKIRSNEQETHGSTNKYSVMGEQSTEARKKHNQLCVTLDGLITGCPLKSIKRMALTYLDPKSVEKVNDMDHLLSSLEVKGIIGVGKYAKLLEIMALANVGIGIDEIQTTAKDIKYILENQIPSQEQSAMSHLDAHTSNKDSINPSPEIVVSETLTKRRPETDGLRQLKGQTEDKLDTIRRLKCILTTQAEKAKKLLEEKRYVVIKGNPGEGKTTTALCLIDNEIYTNRRVVVYSPRDWKMVDTDWVDIIVMEDIFGQSDFDPDRLEEWMVYLPTIQEHVDAEKLQVIITTRVDILSKAYSMLGSLKLFSEDVYIMLSSNELEKSEKMDILNRELQRHKRNVNEDHKEKCIANFDGLIGFPKCCSLFAGDGDLFMRGPTFFKSPEKYFVENITKLKNTAFLSLAFVFCHGKIFEEDLSPETIPESSKCVLIELSSCLHISKKKASITLLRDAYESFLGMYVVKSVSYKSNISGNKSCIEFSHAIIYEAVGHTLGKRCPEMIIKYGTSEFLYQRTYTAAAKNITSQNVFVPVSVYSQLAKRIVGDVIKDKLVRSVVKHSALKESPFMLKLEMELLQNHNGAKEFLMTHSHQDSIYVAFYYHSFNSLQDSSEPYCTTFLQCILQTDADTVKLVYNQFLKFLTCAHKNTTDCWKCKEKQELLELALYYEHFEIADELITMNACYTYVSLYNASRHVDVKRVQTILKSLKMIKTFRSKCKEAKEALCNAYISGNQGIVDCLLKERITLDSKHIRYVVKQGNMNALLDVVEHLKCHNKWIPHWDINVTDREVHYLYRNTFDFGIDRFPFSTALSLAYANEKLDMADYLVKNGVKVSIYMLEDVLKYSQKTVAALIQHLKDADSWDPKCDVASKALENCYFKQKDDLCRLLIQEGVSLRMDSLPCCMFAFKKVIQHLKDNGNWDPKYHCAYKALVKAFRKKKYKVCELLIHNGVSLTMANLPRVSVFCESLEVAQKVIQHLKDSGEWNPNCVDASEALANAFCTRKLDVCELLIQNGVSLKMKNLPCVFKHCKFLESLESPPKVIQHLKETWNWDPKCDSASEALLSVFDCTYLRELLIQNTVSLTMESLFSVTDDGYYVFFDKSYKAEDIIQHLKDTGNWCPNSDAASEALELACWRKNYYLLDLLIDNGVSLNMDQFQHVIYNLLSDDDVYYKHTYLKTTKKAIQNMKDTGNWNPKCDAASGVLQKACIRGIYDVCGLLIQEGVPVALKDLPNVICGLSSESAKKAIQNLKDTGNWYSKCDAASEALEQAYRQKNYDVCDLLIQEGVSLRMNNLPGVILVSLETAAKAIQHMKNTGNWDLKCDFAAEALQSAFRQKNYDVCDLLIHEGVSLTMKNLPRAILLKTLKEGIKHLKDTNNWDSKCDDASKALEKAFCDEKLDVCELLILNGVSLKMKNLTVVINASKVSLKTVEKAIQNLQDTGNWNPKCYDASEVLKNAFCKKRCDVCNLLISKNISLTMTNLPVIMDTDCDSHMKRMAIQHLKDSVKWDPKCDEALEALKISLCKQEFDVCDLLMHDGISLTMKNLLDALNEAEITEKAIQNLQDTGNWDPKCDDASNALVDAFCGQKYDVCELLIQEGVVLTMKNLPAFLKGKYVPLMESTMKAVHHLKDTGNWNPKCDAASELVEQAFSQDKHGLYNLLINEGVPLMMKSLPGIIYQSDLETAKKAIKHLKETGNWDARCDDASEALAKAFIKNNFKVPDLLMQDGISLTMKNLPDIINTFFVPLETAEKAIQNLKDNGNWDPKCNHASESLEKAFCKWRLDVYELLSKDGVVLTMKNLPGVINTFKVSLETVEKAIQNLQDTGNWDPKCDDASKALKSAFCNKNYDVCKLLIHMNISLRMTNLPDIMSADYNLDTVRKVIQHLKDTGNWDPKCDEASEALQIAYLKRKFDVCHMLIEEEVSLTMVNLPDAINAEYDLDLYTIWKVIQHLKDTGNWDPKCDEASLALQIVHLGVRDAIIDASEALDNDCILAKCYVYHLLIHEGILPTVKTLPWWSLKLVTTAVQILKGTGNWDPKCDDASIALVNAYYQGEYDVCDLLIHEGVSLTMETFPCWSLESATKAIQFLKGNGTWDPKCDDISRALTDAYTGEEYDVCDVLIHEGVSLTMKTFPWWSLESATKTIQLLKDNGNWDSKVDDASIALKNAFHQRKYDVYNLLIEEGVSLTMKTFPWWSLESATKAIQFIKVTGNWDPKCDDVSRALLNAYTGDKNDVCDLLRQNGALLTMENLSNFYWYESIERFKKFIQLLKVTNHWDPSSEDAESLLTRANIFNRKDISQVLIEEGVHEPEAKHSDP